ncbi:MAG TPA: hypothetical protein VIC24_05775, partial [Gemmatimonadaceae bacterium]
MPVRSLVRLVLRARFSRSAACIIALTFALVTPRTANAQEARVRARALGVAPGIFRPGPLDAITDVGGVLVGQ